MVVADVGVQLLANQPNLAAPPPQQPAMFHVFLRDPDGDLVQIDVDGDPTVADFLGDCIDFFSPPEQGEQEETFGPLRDLYLATIGGKPLPRLALLKDLVVSGQRVVLHRRLRGGMQSGNWFNISLIY